MSDQGFSVITGAASGIGRATAELLARRSDVLLIDRSEAGLAEMRADLEASGEVLTFTADVSNENEVVAAFASLPPRAVVRTLVNSAGIYEHHPAQAMPTKAWRSVLGVNLDGTFYCCRTAFPSMRPGSVIVNVASLNAHISLSNRVNYAASKAAVIALTKGLAVEWAQHGIRAVSISPGLIDTPMNRQVTAESSGDGDVPAMRVPVGRLGQAAEVAAVIAFLASEAGSYVTGIDLQVDGGLVAYGAM
jgi:3-oxoacyl-[acyl-carrier protein] reductase